MSRARQDRKNCGCVGVDTPEVNPTHENPRWCDGGGRVAATSRVRPAGPVSSASTGLPDALTPPEPARYPLTTCVTSSSSVPRAPPSEAFSARSRRCPAPKLGATAIKAALERAGVAPGDVQLVHMGMVLPAGVGQAPARQAALFAGLPNSVPCVTVNKVCGSGLEAVLGVARAIARGRDRDRGRRRHGVDVERAARRSAACAPA